MYSPAPNMNNLSVYPSADTPRSRYDIALPKSEKIEKVPVIFTVDSLYRNYAVQGRMNGATEISHTQFPRHDYTVPLPSTFRDVLSIELVKASIPISRVDKGDKDRYIILGIGYSRSQGNTANLTGSFCNIYSNDNGKYDYTRSETYADGGHTYYFSEPSTVAKLHITLTYPDGTSPCWGECPVSQTEHVLTFKIWTMNQPVILPV